jgi:hypothetical protein
MDISFVIALSLLSSIFAFLTFLSVLALFFFQYKQSLKIDHIMGELNDFFYGSNNEEEPMQVFRSLDGKYTANSFEELIEKMNNDGVQLNPEQADQMKRMFEDFMEQENQFEIPDEDDGEEWRGK